MKKYIVYNAEGKIQRTGVCSKKDLLKQANEDEFILEGTANDVTQKVEFDGFDVDGQPINPRVVDKTPEEIEAEKPPEILVGERPVSITNNQWQDVLDRLSKLETEA